MFSRSRHGNLPGARGSNQHSHFLYLRSILIVFYHNPNYTHSLAVKRSDRIILHITYVLHECYMPYPSYSSCFNHPLTNVAVIIQEVISYLLILNFSYGQYAVILLTMSMILLRQFASLFTQRLA